jgi:hypothetical protein
MNFLKTEEITTLRNELERLGLLGRVDLNGYDPACLNEEVTRASVPVNNDGRMFVASGGGNHLFNWSCVSGGFNRNRNRFALATGFAVIVVGDRLKLTRWA